MTDVGRKLECLELLIDCVARAREREKANEPKDGRPFSFYLMLVTQEKFVEVSPVREAARSASGGSAEQVHEGWCIGRNSCLEYSRCHAAGKCLRDEKTAPAPAETTRGGNFSCAWPSDCLTPGACDQAGSCQRTEKPVSEPARADTRSHAVWCAFTKDKAALCTCRPAKQCNCTRVEGLHARSCPLFDGAPTPPDAAQGKPDIPPELLIEQLIEQARGAAHDYNELRKGFAPLQEILGLTEHATCEQIVEHVADLKADALRLHREKMALLFPEVARPTTTEESGLSDAEFGSLAELIEWAESGRRWTNGHQIHALEFLKRYRAGRRVGTEGDVRALVDRFLAWPLPDSVQADLCATKRGYPHRSGTNLLGADEARQMIEYLLAGKTGS